MAQLQAKLVDPKVKAATKSAVVEVKVQGLELIDPAVVKEKPNASQGHLHYQVDNGFIIATASPKLSLHALSPGTHTIKVMLVGNDHQPLGPQQSLNVAIP